MFTPDLANIPKDMKTFYKVQNSDHLVISRRFQSPEIEQTVFVYESLTAAETLQSTMGQAKEVFENWKKSLLRENRTKRD